LAFLSFFVLDTLFLGRVFVLLCKMILLNNMEIMRRYQSSHLSPLITPLTYVVVKCDTIRDGCPWVLATAIR
jgi:hypothetical protein